MADPTPEQKDFMTPGATPPPVVVPPPPHGTVGEASPVRTAVEAADAASKQREADRLKAAAPKPAPVDPRFAKQEADRVAHEARQQAVRAELADLKAAHKVTADMIVRLEKELVTLKADVPGQFKPTQPDCPPVGAGNRCPNCGWVSGVSVEPHPCA